MELGTVVVFEPNNFNPEFWNSLPEALVERTKLKIPPYPFED